jgi:hypothetical protein
MLRFSALLCLLFLVHTAPAQSLQKLYPVSYSQVVIKDAFWSPRLKTVAETLLKACIDYTEAKTGRIRNFEGAAAHKKSSFESIYYDDSDGYKAREARA